MAGGGMQWCSDCGAEHRPTARDCVFCGGALTPEPSDPTDTASPADHTVGHLAISALTPAERNALTLLLGSADVPHVLEGNRLRIPTRHLPAAEAVLAGVLEPLDHASEPSPVSEKDAQATTPRGNDPRNHHLATTARRVTARMLSWFGLSIAVAIFGPWLTTTASGQRLPAAPTAELFIALVLLEGALIAHFGWDVGKVVLGLRVTDGEGRSPGWRRAMERTLVMWGPYLSIHWLAWALADSTAGVTLAVTVATYVWVAALVWSIAADAEHRGWHDRVAGTWVVRYGERISAPVPVDRGGPV